MNSFSFNPLEVGNFMTLGAIEESLVNDIDFLIQYSQQYPNTVSSYDVVKILDKYNVKYFNLPNYIKDKIDKICII